MLGRDTPPAPLKRGGWDAVFFLVIRGLLCLFPLLIGDKGVCYGERRGLGCFCCFFLRWCLLASGGCFGFRWLCSDVTHPLPLSRGEF